LTFLMVSSHSHNCNIFIFFVSLSLQLIYMYVLGNKSAAKPKNISTKRSALEYELAYTYIKNVVESEVVDKSAHVNYDKHIYLPYSKKRYFYGEYIYLSQQQSLPERASESVFNKARVKLFSDKAKAGVFVRFSSGKGSFDKCDICHNADQLLNGSHGWSDTEKEIIQAYRRRHISHVSSN
jgi:hypothetical protein